MVQIILIIFGLAILIALIQFIFPYVIIGLIVYVIYRVIRYVRKVRYFNSEEFIQHKAQVDSTVKEYNEISEYIKEIPNNSQFMPSSSEKDYSHLASFENTSKHNYSRSKNKKTTNTQNVYSTSLQVVKKASENPIAYLCKYFEIKPNQENLDQLQKIGTNISRMENTIENLQLRQKDIEESFNPPKFIMKYYYKELMDKIGMDVPAIDMEYAQYVFEYISAGGNSSQKSVITFNGETIEAVMNHIAEKIHFFNSAKGQRALMTNRLRIAIKERDNYTCKMCSASVQEQSLLLLEVDHIVPVSKGGMSTYDNLQTLCWKCNRSKSDKIL